MLTCDHLWEWQCTTVNAYIALQTLLQFGRTGTKGTAVVQCTAVNASRYNTLHFIQMADSALYRISYNGQIVQCSSSLLRGVCSPVISVGITEGRWRVDEDDDDEEDGLSQLSWL